MYPEDGVFSIFCTTPLVTKLFNLNFSASVHFASSPTAPEISIVYFSLVNNPNVLFSGVVFKSETNLNLLSKVLNQLTTSP